MNTFRIKIYVSSERKLVILLETEAYVKKDVFCVLNQKSLFTVKVTEQEH